MNRKNSGANTNMVQICLDLIVNFLAFYVECLIFPGGISGKDYSYGFVVVVVFSIIFILSNKEARLYNVTLFFYMDRFWKIITKSWLLATATTAMIMLVFDATGESRNIYFVFLGISYVFIVINMIFSRLIQQLFHTYQAPRAAFVGVFADYQKFHYFMNKTSIRIEEIGYILKDGQESEGRFNVLGNVHEMEKIIRSCEMDQIFFMMKNDDKSSEIQEYIDICLEMGVTVKVVMDNYIMRKSNSFVSSIGTYPTITYHTITLNGYEQMLKRIMDVFVSVIAIVISSPFMIAAAIAIKLDSPGPIIFKQVRVGQNGRHFHIYKFRSMYIDAEERKKELLAQNEMSGGVMFKMKNDPRITRVGKFIRKTSVDELPQLFNVLQGTMSLVGTRPPTLDEVEKYERSQWRRISIKPGITGMWQVYGRSDVTKFEDVVELDLRYIDNWSLWLDLKLLFRTVGVLFARKGAY